MKCAAIAAAIAAALSLPAFATGSGQADEPAAAAERGLVTAVQAQLGVVPADGKTGPRTRAALKQFQRTKGLEPSGELDPQTLKALGVGGPKPSSAAGESAHMQGKPSTPIGPSQSSAERAAETLIKHDAPTGVTK